MVKLLPVLKHFVDGCGEVTLSEQEAERIRPLGFRNVAAGRWKVPPVPPELVRDNPLLEHLSIGWDSRHTEAQPIPTKEDGQQPKTPTSKYSSEAARRQSRAHELPIKILRAVETVKGKIQKRRLQQRFWRYPVQSFNNALRELLADQIVNSGQRARTEACYTGNRQNLGALRRKSGCAFRDRTPDPGRSVPLAL